MLLISGDVVNEVRANSTRFSSLKGKEKDVIKKITILFFTLQWAEPGGIGFYLIDQLLSLSAMTLLVGSYVP